MQGRPHIWGHGEMSSPCFRPFPTENYMAGTQQFTSIKLYSICVLAMFWELRAPLSNVISIIKGIKILFKLWDIIRKWVVIATMHYFVSCLQDCANCRFFSLTIKLEILFKQCLSPFLPRLSNSFKQILVGFQKVQLCQVSIGCL